MMKHRKPGSADPESIAPTVAEPRLEISSRKSGLVGSFGIDWMDLSAFFEQRFGCAA